METQQAIFSRTSTRTFSTAPIPRQQLQTILLSAMVVPAAHTRTGCKLYVLNSQQMQRLVQVMAGSAVPVATAATGILVLGDISAFNPPTLAWGNNCAAAVQNMALTATDLGIGNTWVGVWPSASRGTAVQQALSLPNNMQPHSILLLGYPTTPRKAPAPQWRQELIYSDSFVPDPQ